MKQAEAISPVASLSWGETLSFNSVNSPLRERVRNKNHLSLPHHKTGQPESDRGVSHLLVWREGIEPSHSRHLMLVLKS